MSPEHSQLQSDDPLLREVHGLLRASPTNPCRLTSRENSRLEYKETFNWGNRAHYAKTMAAFANKDGGFIVFGVKDSPRDLVGVNAERFDALDPSRVAEFLNSAFLPEIPWELFRTEIAGIPLGIVAVLPAVGRPVVCIKNDRNELREADIYYRYRGRTERIKYPELQRMILESQERERNSWLEHLSKVAQIGVENVGVLDLNGGELSGQRGRLLVSRDTLDKIKFIREGQCTDGDDAEPTIRLEGDVLAVDAKQIIRPFRTVTEPLVIGEKELFREFLLQGSPDAPMQYLRQACRERSLYVPVYHFTRAAKIGLNGLRDFVAQESERRPNRLLDRIDGDMIVPVGSLDSDTVPSMDRRCILEKLRVDDTHGLRQAEHLRLFEAVTHLNPPDPPTRLMSLLADIIFSRFDKMNSPERSLCRKAVSYLDEVLNRAACDKEALGATL